MSGADAGIAWLTGQASARAELVDSLDDPAWLVDAADLSVLHANRAAAAWFDLAPQALQGRAADSLLKNLEDVAFWAEVRCGAPGALDSDTELERADGSLAQVHRRVVPIGQLRAGLGGVSGYLVVLRDRSSEHRAEQERDALLAELRATLEATADGILVTDLHGRIQAFNKRFAALWSLPESALAVRHDDEAIQRWMSSQVLAPAAYQARLAEIEAHALLSAVDTLQLLDGAQIERHMQPQWRRGRPIGRVYSFRELNPSRRGAPRPDRSRAGDERSRWPERNGFVQLVDDAVGVSRRDGRPLALLCIEFDRDGLFALDGESHARAMGDIVEALRAHVPVQHTLARLGGVRFGVLLQGGGEAAAEALARRLVEQAGFPPGGLLATAGLMVSIGIAAYPQAGLCADDLLAHGEQAMEQARQAGVPSWRVHGFDVADDGPRLVRLQRALHEGGPGQTLRLRYLPRIDMATGRVQAVEALLRWHDGEHGLLPPAQFLPLAERAGLAGALDDWALEQALHQAARWRAAGFVWRLNLNLSAAQCRQPGFARRVAAALQAAEWPAELLEFDVHEAALQADPELAEAQLRALRDLGVQIVLDDFGRGDASLNLLRRFPLNAVKIDRELVHAMAKGSLVDAGMVAAMAGAARACGLAVYAEGVELEAQCQALAALGITGWQGFLHSRPLDAAGLQARLANDRRAGQAGALKMR
jgi:EAL domain-containing protein (putative c-di-GMP-specific phosphodiesterase class I)/GGDEF domain-containing protein